VALDEFIVMPDHIHGIVVFTQDARNVLGDAMGSFKSAVTRGINLHRAECNLAPVKVWQRNYWEHVIRDEKDFENHRRYILENPIRWQTKQDFPA